jgi:hypothetical protein
MLGVLGGVFAPQFARNALHGTHLVMLKATS